MLVKFSSVGGGYGKYAALAPQVIFLISRSCDGFRIHILTISPSTLTLVYENSIDLQRILINHDENEEETVFSSRFI